jgi:phosphate:Na+ symporter
MDYAGIIIGFLGSLGLFLFGMTVLSSALQKTAGCKMKQLLGRMSKSRFRGVLFGAGVTAVIQSSTATTVMAVGFVNAGIISLTQTVGIIMGANIGSTTTSWLVSSVEWAAFLKPDVLGAVCAAGGALLLLFSKKGNLRNIGEVIVGFGVLFIGLSSMPAAVKPLAEMDAVRDIFAALGGNPLLALLAGILVTGVIQSSTASIGILQSMAVTGMIPWSAAVFIVLGQNVGTCFTTMLTSIGANRNTKAASYVHFVYNAVGAVVFSAAAFVFFTFVNPSMGAESASSTNVSMIHTGYNALLLLILFPLGALILKIAEKMASADKDVTSENKCSLTELDESILETPQYAFMNGVKAANKLAETVRANIAAASGIFIDKKYGEIDGFKKSAEDADKANEVIKSFIAKLYNNNLSEIENVAVAALLHNLTGLQRISNHTKGIVKQAEAVKNGNLEYAESASEVLRVICAKAAECYEAAAKALAGGGAKYARQSIQWAEEVQGMREEYKIGHFERVSGGEYNVQSGIVFMETVRHFARIASHSKNIAETAASWEKDGEDDI